MTHTHISSSFFIWQMFNLFLQDVFESWNKLLLLFLLLIIRFFPFAHLQLKTYDVRGCTYPGRWRELPHVQCQCNEWNTPKDGAILQQKTSLKDARRRQVILCILYVCVKLVPYNRIPDKSETVHWSMTTCKYKGKTMTIYLRSTFVRTVSVLVMQRQWVKLEVSVWEMFSLWEEATKPPK